MISSLELLRIAFALSVLSYYIGTLLLALPVPIRGVKRWGAKLIVDGLYATILMFAVTLLFEFTDKFMASLGASFDEITASIRNKYLETLFVFMLTKTIATLASKFSLKMVSSLLNVYASMLATVITILNLLIVLLVLGWLGRSILVPLGLVLMALPFRIGRSAGASLIAFTIASSVLLPLFPHWLDLVYTLTPLPGQVAGSLSSDKVYAVICVRPLYGYATVLDVMFKKVGSETKYELIGANGCAYAIRPGEGIEPGNYTMLISSMGIGVVYTRINVPGDLKRLPIAGLADYYLIAKAPHALFLGPNGYVVMDILGCVEGTIKVHVRSIGQYTIECRVNETGAPVHILLGYPKECKVNFTVDKTKYRTVRINVYELNWHDIPVNTSAIYLVPNADVIELYLHIDTATCPETVTPKMEEEYCSLEDLELYAPSYSDRLLTDIVFLVTWYFAQNLVAVVSYTALLVMVTHGIGKALGASYVRFPFPV